jgi:hypothetical protein
LGGHCGSAPHIHCSPPVLRLWLFEPKLWRQQWHCSLVIVIVIPKSAEVDWTFVMNHFNLYSIAELLPLICSWTMVSVAHLDFTLKEATSQLLATFLANQ